MGSDSICPKLAREDRGQGVGKWSLTPFTFNDWSA
jgi:hypothetical protein